MKRSEIDVRPLAPRCRSTDPAATLHVPRTAPLQPEVHRMVRLLLLVLAGAFASGLAAAQDPSPPAPSIVTSAEATVRGTRDRAFVPLAVETGARNPRDANRDNAEARTA